MWKWLKKLFNKKEDVLDMEKEQRNDIEDAVNAVVNGTSPKKRKHKLEIQVYEADYTDVPDGASPKWRPVRSDPALGGGGPVIIEVADKKELAEVQQRYAMCDQQIKVIREIDPFDDSPKPAAQKTIPQNNQAIPVTQNLQTAAVQTSPLSQPTAVKLKPKIVTIGDMQVKYDGDKVYQKQWVKLNANESANFRIVNDSNNKIVPLNGKHIECKKWVIVEEDSEDIENDVMNGIGD